MDNELKMMMYAFEGMMQELETEEKEVFQKYKQQATEALEGLEEEESQIAALAYFLTAIKQF